MKRLLLALLIPVFLFGLDLTTLNQKSKEKDEKFLSSVIESSKVYENETKVPNNLKTGDTFIIEDEYGAKTLYILAKNGEMNAVSDPYFVALLNKDSASTFSNLFVSSTGQEFSTTGSKPSAKDNPFKEYVSETDAVRIESLRVSTRTDYMEKALNDFLLDNSISPASIINIHPIMDGQAELKLLIFYRP